MSHRRDFLKKSLLAGSAVMLQPLTEAHPGPAGRIELSLAEWSLQRSIREGKFTHLDFAAKAKEEFGISTVEYVNGLFGNSRTDFKEAGQNPAYLREMLTRSQDVGVTNHLIMIDEEGPLAGLDEKERLQAVDNHRKWLDAAKFLECRTVRVNLHGEGDPEMKKLASIDSLSRLGELAGKLDLNIVVENHGGDSSKGFWLAAIIKEVGRYNVGTLPDFGNFCITHPWGTTQPECEDQYDRYKGIEELLPYAKGVSAKTYDFDANGEQPKMDYKRLIGLVKQSGFNGYIGIEYEGFNQPEDEGIKNTIKLLKKYL
jgi:sugar phosphate isomerase/epimerase